MSDGVETRLDGTTLAAWAEANKIPSRGVPVGTPRYGTLFISGQAVRWARKPP